MLILAATVVGAKNPLLPDPGELIVGAVAFFVAFGILAKLAFPQIQKTYAERTERIEGGLKRAEDAQQEAQQTLADYRAQLAEARHEATRIREEAMADAAQRRREIEDDARRHADEMLDRAREQIEASRTQALMSLRAEVGRLGVTLAERIVRASLADDARQRALVDEFLDSLDEMGGGQDNGAPVGAGGPAGGAA